jgi:glutamine amidotransferase
VTIDLVDYGAGNLTSVIKAFRAVGADVRVRTQADDLAGARAIVVPGVGNFHATASLDASWHTAIRQRIADGASLLGICLGLQWLFEGSEEAPGLPGLGWFPGRSALIPGNDGRLKVPHVGWNLLERTGVPSRLLDGIGEHEYTYFAHSFAAPEGDATVARTRHGVPFSSVVERDRVFGAQFHPEKSGAAGLRLLANFVRLSEGAR